MTTAIRCSQWDDSAWDDVASDTTGIAASDTFNVSVVDVSNRVVRLLPLSSNFTGEIRATDWDDSTMWSGQVALPFTVNQTFTVTSVALGDRIVYLSG